MKIGSVEGEVEGEKQEVGEVAAESGAACLDVIVEVGDGFGRKISGVEKLGEERRWRVDRTAEKEPVAEVEGSAEKKGEKYGGEEIDWRAASVGGL